MATEEFESGTTLIQQDCPVSAPEDVSHAPHLNGAILASDYTNILFDDAWENSTTLVDGTLNGTQPGETTLPVYSIDLFGLPPIPLLDTSCNLASGASFHGPQTISSLDHGVIMATDEAFSPSMQPSLSVETHSIDKSVIANWMSTNEGLDAPSTVLGSQNYATSTREMETRWDFALRCPHQPCDFKFNYRDSSYRDHLKTVHPALYVCSVCKKDFEYQGQLSYHAETARHQTFKCEHEGCDKAFSRVDTFQRHQKNHQEDAKRFPCMYCKKYRGANGFKRKDHLDQHVRGYHHIVDGANGIRLSLCLKRCRHEDCLYYRSPNVLFRPFQKNSEYIEHMRSVHNESDYPCPESECDRVGKKGYFRKADLFAHLRKVHDITDATIPDVK